MPCVLNPNLWSFFFQAEDGIRDADVTGVQTCALPILIGVSGGAAVCVAIVFWLTGLGILLPSWVQPLAAFVGAVIALLLVLKISANQSDSMSYLILAGIAVSVLAGAIIGLLSYLATDNALRQISFWSMGSLSAASWNWVIVM